MSVIMPQLLSVKGGRVDDVIICRLVTRGEWREGQKSRLVVPEIRRLAGRRVRVSAVLNVVS